MGFSGSALWERIARVKESVRVPVIGNGDITAPRDAAEMRSQTGCDSVMIGRGTYGNPWLFRQILQLFRGEEPSAVSAAERTDTALWHLREYRRVYGEARTAREMKKHLAAYTRGIENGAALRNRLFRAESTAELEFAIAEAFAR